VPSEYVVTIGEARDKMGDKEEQLQDSHYLNAGAPTHCFLPDCRAPFEISCVHGDDGHYYCSHWCASQARKMGLSHVVRLSQKRS